MNGKKMALIALLLAGCGAEFSVPDSEINRAIWQDPETGCNYIVYRHGFGSGSVGSLSVRYRSDGVADCPDAPEQTIKEKM